VKSVLPTAPGTEMNVNPEMDVPIIPNATNHHGDCRLAVKKELVSAPLDVKNEMAINKPKYRTRIPPANCTDIDF
jgi:hypothetical protein